MGTQHIKLWDTCVKAFESINSHSDRVDVLIALAAESVKQLQILTACPKATWKKVVLEMQVCSCTVLSDQWKPC